MMLVKYFLSSFKNNFSKKKIYFDINYNIKIINILKIFVKKGLIFNFRFLNLFKVRIYLNTVLATKIKFDYSISDFSSSKNWYPMKKKLILFLICQDNQNKFTSFSSSCFTYLNSMVKKPFNLFIYVYG